MEGLLYHDCTRGLEVQFGPAGGRENFEKCQRIAPTYAAKASKELLSMTPTRSGAGGGGPAAASPPPAPALSEPAAPPTDTVRPVREGRSGRRGAGGRARPAALVNPNYTRVVVYVDRETDFHAPPAEKRPQPCKPPRLLMWTWANSTLGGGKQKTIPDQ